jgi:hypothetical protein
MNAELNRKSIQWGLGGFAIQLLTLGLPGWFGRPGMSIHPGAISMHDWIPFGGGSVGSVLLLVGLAYFCKAKGRHLAWCVLGFLPMIGLIMLAVLRDRSKPRSVQINRIEPLPASHLDVFA